MKMPCAGWFFSLLFGQKRDVFYEKHKKKLNKYS